MVVNMRFPRLILLTFCLIFSWAVALAQPVITGQVPNPIRINEGQSFVLTLGHLTVNDVNYPTGYSLSIAGGVNYTVGGNTITPDAGFHGNLIVPVTVNDGTTDSDPFNLSVVVNNIPEITAQDVLSTLEDVTKTISLADVTVTDPDNSAVDFTLIVSAGTNYTFSGLDITPNSNFNGPLTVNLQVTDGEATSAVFPLLISVTAVNDLPNAASDATSTNEDVSVNLNVVTNDIDSDGTINAATVSLTSASTAEGTWTVNASGVVTFTPVSNFSGTAIQTYTVQDNSGGVSNLATITITVNAINDNPTAGNDATTTNEDVAVNLNVVTNDTDIDGTINAATVSLTSASTAEGSWTVNASGVVTFTPVSNFSGTAIQTYTVQDNQGGVSNLATITITVSPVNDNPTAVNDVASTNEEVAVSVTVTTNDTDVDGTINPATVSLTSASTAAGTWSVNASGLVTFTPVSNFSGPAIQTYTVQDNQGGISNLATITITVNPINDNPVAVNDATSTNEDVAVNLNVTTNDTDIDGTIDVGTVDLNTTTGGIQNTNTSTGGSWSVNSLGLVTFTPTANFSGSSTLNYTVNDNEGATSNVATITITVIAVNDPPIAVNDALTVTEDNSGTVNVTLNDSDSDGTINVASVDLNTATLGIQNSNTTVAGTWSVNASGVVTFNPTLNFNGAASLTYTVNDDGGATSNEATLAVTVTAVNDAPVASGDATTTAEETSITVNVVTNDTDVDGTIDATSVDLNTSTAGIQNSNTTAAGSWSVNTSGVVTFIPVTDFSGSATLTYTVNDNNGLTSNQATISITVTPVNDPPTAVNDAITTNEDVSVNLNVTTNDTDIDGTINAATVDLNTGTAGIQNANTTAAGSWSVNATGVVTFAPALNFSGSATLPYTVNDNGGATSNAATITITVTAVNDAPLAVSDAASTNEDTSVNVTVLSNDTDVDGSLVPTSVDLNTTTAGVQTTNTTAAGSWTVNSLGVVSFTPVANFNGSATLNYTVNDDGGLTSNSATITVTVTPINDTPVANNDAASTNEETPVVIPILTNDTDPDGSGTINTGTVDLNPAAPGIQNSITIAAGTFVVNASGVVTFTPAANFNGIASTTYTVNDNAGATSNVATISVTVISINDTPVAVDDATTTNEDVAVSLNVTSNDTDPDGSINAASVDLNTGSAGIQNTNTTAAGNWSVNASGLVTYTPTANFTGTATLQYRVNDNEGTTSNTATITITVNAVNDAPVAVNDAVTTNEDTPININVVSNDTDVDGSINATTVDLNTTTAGIQTTATISGGTVSVNASGVVTYTPTVNFYGIATASYTVNDNAGLTSNVATITFTVNAVNDPPIANNDITSADENEVVTFNVVTNDIDIDGAVNPASVDLNLSVAGIQNTVTVTGGTFTVDATGLVTYTPSLNFNGNASTTYTVRDDQSGVSNTATITVTVNSINSSPIANSDAATTNEDAPTTFTIVSNDTDPDGSINAATVDLNTAVAGIQNSNTTASGTFVVNPSGILTFTPVANFNGSIAITYTVNDNVGATSNAATITITVTSVNDAPVANNDAGSGNEGTAITVNVIANDTDVDGTIDAASVDLNTSLAGIQNTNTTAAGTWSVNAAGVVTFTSVNNFNATATLNYTVNDNNGATSNVASISIAVNGVNDPPVAANDATTTNEDVAITLNLVTNDTDEEGGLSPSSVDLNTATVGIQNNITNAAGTFTVNSSGVLTYTPTTNFNGTASITYTVNDVQGLTSNIATVTITVNPVNDVPVAVNDAVTTDEDNAVTFSVTTNDTDVDGTIDATTVDLNTTLAGIQNTFTSGGVGTFTVNAAGNVTFTPIANYFGTANLTYRVNDNAGATSNTATMSVTVNAVNDQPAFNVINDVILLENAGQQTITITGITAGPLESQSLLLTVISGNTTLIPQPTITYSSPAATATLQFTPAPSQIGTAVITVKLVDTGLSEFTRTFQVQVTEINDPPTLDAIAFGPILEDALLQNVPLTGITAGPGENQSLTVSVTSNNAALFETLDVQYTSPLTTGTLRIKPKANANGSAVITVTVTDSGPNTPPPSDNNTARQFTLVVTSVNDLPVFQSTPVTAASVNELYEYIISVTDVDGEAITLTAISKPSWATLTILGNGSAKLSGTPPPGAAGTVNIKIQAKDPTGAPVVQEFDLVVNARPTVANFTTSTTEDTPKFFTQQLFTSAFTDPDGGTIASIRIDKLPNSKKGILKLNGVNVTLNQEIPFASIGQLQYDPLPDSSGIDTLRWNATDGVLYANANAMAIITTTAVNDAPVVTNLEASELVYEKGLESPKFITESLVVKDVDDDSLQSAEIRFQLLSFNTANDVLAYTSSQVITGGYNPQSGVLLLSGKASLAEYTQVIRSIQYNYINLTNVDEETKIISITLNDGKLSGPTSDRTIRLTYEFIPLDIPTGFTPNGDNVNDSWNITEKGGGMLLQYPASTVKVYNSRGVAVFETTGFEQQWDGTFNGELLPPDSYFYTIEIKEFEPSILYKGVITILR